MDNSKNSTATRVGEIYVVNNDEENGTRSAQKRRANKMINEI